MLKPKGKDFKSISDFNSEWADRIAYLILVGLAVDVGALFIANKCWHRAAIIFANLLIAGGIFGELKFAKRARNADDSRVADAERATAEANKAAGEARERAAEAELDLATYRKPRSLNESTKAEHITIKMAEFAGTKFAIFLCRPDGDMPWLAIDIAFCLIAAKWEQIPCGLPSKTWDSGFTDLGLFGTGDIVNDVVVGFPFNNNDLDRIATALASAISSEEISAVAMPIPNIPPLIRVSVGPKS